MTKFAHKTFVVTLGGEGYREGWEKIFGKKKEEKTERCEHGKLAPNEACGWCVGEQYGEKK